MKFFNLPKWIVWTLVSLLALLLCAVWQWKRAMNLLDTTAEKLDDAVKRKEEADARAKKAEESAEKERQLRAKREEIANEVKLEIDKINKEREAKVEANKQRASETRQTVARTGSAVENLKAWRSKKRGEPK